MKHLSLLLCLAMTLFLALAMTDAANAQSPSEPAAFELSTPIQQPSASSEPTVKKSKQPFSVAPISTPGSHRLDTPQQNSAGKVVKKPGKKPSRKTPSRNAQLAAPQLANPNLSTPELTLPGQANQAPSMPQPNTPTLRHVTLKVEASPRGSVTYDPLPQNPANPSYAIGTVVTLTANPTETYKFSQWEGPCQPLAGTPKCRLTMNQNTVLTPVFIQKNTQMVHLTLNGRGRVVSVPAGLDCGEGHTQCEAPFWENSSVQLQATPSPKQSFEGWGFSGKPGIQCDTNNKYRNCTFRLSNAEQGVHADFSNKVVLTVQFAPESSGLGALRDNAGLLDCTSPSSCSAGYELNTLVPLQLAPTGDATFEQWAYVENNQVRPLGSVGNLLNVRMDGDKTVQVLLHSQAFRTDQRMRSVGCVKRNGSDTEYTCNNMNGYAVCHSAFREDRVSDCHVSFDASGFRELNLTREPDAELITREANITVHRGERGRSDGIRGVTYRMTFETPAPLPADRNSPCRGQAGCNSPCYVQIELKEDGKTGELISLLNKKTSCDNVVEIPITPSTYHGYKAFDMCRDQAQSRNLRSWNFDIDASVSERIGTLYWFRRLASQTRNSRQYETVRLKRTTTVAAPMRIQCRD